jgi:hypothetical protein
MAEQLHGDLIFLVFSGLVVTEKESQKAVDSEFA